MNISYYDFKNLPDQSQRDIVVNQGLLMNETVKNKLRFSLYELSSFSVEVVYNTSDNRITSLNVFQNKSAYSN